MRLLVMTEQLRKVRLAKQERQARSLSSRVPAASIAYSFDESCSHACTRFSVLLFIRGDTVLLAPKARLLRLLRCRLRRLHFFGLLSQAILSDSAVICRQVDADPTASAPLR